MPEIYGRVPINWQKLEWLQEFQKISDVSDESYRDQRAYHNNICLLKTSVGLHVEFDDYPQCAFGNSVHLAWTDPRVWYGIPGTQNKQFSKMVWRCRNITKRWFPSQFRLVKNWNQHVTLRFQIWNPTTLGPQDRTKRGNFNTLKFRFITNEACGFHVIVYPIPIWPY